MDQKVWVRAYSFSAFREETGVLGECVKPLSTPAPPLRVALYFTCIHDAPQGTVASENPVL